MYEITYLADRLSSLEMSGHFVHYEQIVLVVELKKICLEVVLESPSESMAPLRLLLSILHTMRRLQQSLLCVQTFLARTSLALLYSCT